MPSDDAEMVSSNSVDINTYRKLVQTYINLHLYESALFWSDKVVALSGGKPKDIYWHAQCMYLLKQYHRAAHLLKIRNLDKTYILCNKLTVQCLYEANEYAEALRVLNSMNFDVFLLKNYFGEPEKDFVLFDNTPKPQVQSSILLLKGKVLEAMDNRGLAADCFKEALQCDVHCYEAFESLVQHQMLTAIEEEELISSLRTSDNWDRMKREECEILLLLYRSKLKKYHTPTIQVDPKSEQISVLKSIQRPIGLVPISPLLADQSFTTENKTTNQQQKPSKKSTRNSTGNLQNITPVTTIFQSSAKDDNDEKRLEFSVLIQRLNTSLDMLVAQAEHLYYNCDYQRCSTFTEEILKQDPYHSGCLPIHISCQVELKNANKLFTLAHNLVDLYPNLAISWFAVGCYYYTIAGKSDQARRYLAKATTLDRLFGPAWLAYGHSFAIENEHDQAMAAYFKASQLMKGCHLPLLYIGLECGLTNNARLADKFFQQANKIAPNDPFVLHEMGVIAYQNSNFNLAETYFQNALQIIQNKNNSILPERMAPLLNNLAHTLRKQNKYEEALSYHHESLVLAPQNASTYSAIAYIYALTHRCEEAAEWFHKALGMRRDDTFSTTMLNYILEQLTVENPPFPGAPSEIPDFDVELVAPNRSNTTVASTETAVESPNTSTSTALLPTTPLNPSTSSGVINPIPQTTLDDMSIDMDISEQK